MPAVPLRNSLPQHKGRHGARYRCALATPPATLHVDLSGSVRNRIYWLQMCRSLVIIARADSLAQTAPILTPQKEIQLFKKTIHRSFHSQQTRTRTEHKKIKSPPPPVLTSPLFRLQHDALKLPARDILQRTLKVFPRRLTRSPLCGAQVRVDQLDKPIEVLHRNLHIAR